MSGVIVVNDGGTWKSPNFDGGAVYAKAGGVWESLATAGRAVFAKKSGVWEKVFPSASEAWTTSKLATTAASNENVNYNPQLSTDPTYVYTKLLTAAAEARWEGYSVGPPHYTAEGIDLSAYGWSPTTIAGFGYGAVSRLEVVATAKMNSSRSPADLMEIQPFAGSKKSAAMTTGFVTYTYDYTTSAWGLANSAAGELHTANRRIRVSPYHFSPLSKVTSVKDVKARIKYYYN